MYTRVFIIVFHWIQAIQLKDGGTEGKGPTVAGSLGLCTNTIDIQCVIHK